uniref:Glutamine ABC transporter substrate-binding protein n=1 Tax=uncultured Candidatus Melainabacteria bacterium TaxID=2682970 RepID=A0A650EIZ5_9BACT|nr:glutamine ABC transporter substrate-binding protein [uncultured Candidatus Melainabacteria bacterium]
MLKKIISMLMVVMFLCCGCGKKQDEPLSNDLNNIIKRDKLIVGVKTDTYPFGYLDEKGHYSGYDAALARIIARGILGSDKKVEFIPVTASDRMMKLYSSDVDMIIATMSVTPKRKELLDFSMPYHTAGQALLVRKGSNIKALRDLSGKKAIIVFGSTSEMSLRSAVPNVGVLGYKNYVDAYKALKAGKADAIVSDDTILLGMALKDDSVVLLPKRYTKENYAVAFRKGIESRDLVRAVNNVIDIETRKGNLKKLKANYGIK